MTIGIPVRTRESTWEVTSELKVEGLSCDALDPAREYCRRCEQSEIKQWWINYHHVCLAKRPRAKWLSPEKWCDLRVKSVILSLNDVLWCRVINAWSKHGDAGSSLVKQCSHKICQSTLLYIYRLKVLPIASERINNLAMLYVAATIDSWVMKTKSKHQTSKVARITKW